MNLRVVLAPDGQATVAWFGNPDAAGSSPVLVSERAPGGGAFPPPVTLGRSDGTSVALGRSEGGVRAVVWPLKASVAPAGAGFAAAEDVPTPPRAPDVHPELVPSPRSFGPMSVTVAPDGAVLVGYLDSDVHADNQRAVTVLRRPDGSWTEPEILDDYSSNLQVVADAVGGLHAMWETAPHTANDPITLHVADAAADGHFGPGRVVSNPEWRTSGSLVTNRRGDLLVAWSAQAYGPVIGATSRPAGADWQPPELLYGGTPYGGHPSGALDEGGDAAVAWTNGNAFARSRPAGKDWAQGSTTFVRQGALTEYAVAMDADGTGLVVSSACRSVGTVDTVVASTLPPGGSLQPVVTISSGQDPLSRPEIATDRFGNGLVVWERGAINRPSTVFASGYSARPPAVDAFRAGEKAFTLRVSEPARVTVTVSGRRRRAVEWSRVRPGKNELRFSGNVRSLLAHRGRYRATVRARDSGPRASRARTITFTR